MLNRKTANFNKFIANYKPICLFSTNNQFQLRQNTVSSSDLTDEILQEIISTPVPVKGGNCVTPESVVGRFHKGAKPRKFTHRNQFDFMLYCILNQVRSLRDGLDTFNFHEGRLYHLGFKSRPCLSTVSEANRNRSYRGYEELFEILKYDISRRERKEIDAKLKIIDSTTISIDDKRVAWASFRRDKRGIKIHLMLDEHDIFPASVVVTPGKSSECRKGV